MSCPEQRQRDNREIQEAVEAAVVIVMELIRNQFNPLNPQNVVLSGAYRQYKKYAVVISTRVSCLKQAQILLRTTHVSDSFAQTLHNYTEAHSPRAYKFQSGITC